MQIHFLGVFLKFQTGQNSKIFYFEHCFFQKILWRALYKFPIKKFREKIFFFSFKSFEKKFLKNFLTEKFWKKKFVRKILKKNFKTKILITKILLSRKTNCRKNFEIFFFFLILEKKFQN